MHPNPGEPVPRLESRSTNHPGDPPPEEGASGFRTQGGAGAVELFSCTGAGGLQGRLDAARPAYHRLLIRFSLARWLACRRV